MRQVGVLFHNPPLSDLTGPVPSHRTAKALLEGLRDAGWNEGNLRIHWRSAEQRYERRPALLEELLRLPVDLLITEGSSSTWEALAKTRTVPIVGIGFRPFEKMSLARPGGNVTGILRDTDGAIWHKQLEMLLQIAPKATRVAGIHPSYATGNESPVLMGKLGITWWNVKFPQADRIDSAIEVAARQGAQGLFFGDWAPFDVPENQQRIARATARHRLPAIHTYHGIVEQGGLISYAVDILAQWRRAGYFVNKILNGTSPGDIPVEQVARHILEINAGTARALGLQIPPTLLTMADRVLE